MDRVDKALVFFQGKRCGVVSRGRDGYRFQYDVEYLKHREGSFLSDDMKKKYAATLEDRIRCLAI